MNTLLLPLLGCPLSPVDSDTDGETGDTVVDTDTAPPPVPLVLQDVPAERAPGRYGLVTDGSRLYALRADGPTLHFSDDLGVTWARGPAVDGFLVQGRGEVFVAGASGVARLTEGGASTEPLALPVGQDAAGVRWLGADGDGALWLSSVAAPIALWRSVDGGESWVEAELPQPAEHVFACPVAAGGLVVIADFARVTRWSGSAFVDLGAVTEPSDCFGTPGGAVHVVAEEPPVERRLPAGSDAWEERALAGYVGYRALGDVVLRVSGDGTVETSADDGATFAPAVGTLWDHTLHTHVAVGGTLVALAASLYGQQGVARWTPPATSWTQASIGGLPLYARVRDLAFAEDGRAAMLVNESPLVALYAQDPDGVWYRGAELTAAEARAVAIRPDGERVAVGGDDGVVRFYDALGARAVWSGQMVTAGGYAEPNAVTSLAWADTSGEPVLLIATADASDTAGNVWRGVWNVDHPEWDVRTPTSSTESITLRYGGYHALTAHGAQGSLDFAVQLRSWYTTNGWLAAVLSGNVLSTTTDLWEGDSVWVDAALSTSISPVDGTWVQLWSEGRLVFSRPEFAPRFPDATLPREGLAVARFDPQGRLWIGGEGFFARTEPLTVDWSP